MSGDIEIRDKEAFPGRLSKIKQANNELRSIVGEFDAVHAEMERESKSFTRGDVAPVYAGMLRAVSDWRTSAREATNTVCDSADNCVATAQEKFTKITGADIEGADKIKKL